MPDSEQSDLLGKFFISYLEALFDDEVKNGSKVVEEYTKTKQDDQVKDKQKKRVKCGKEYSNPYKRKCDECHIFLPTMDEMRAELQGEKTLHKIADETKQRGKEIKITLYQPTKEGGLQCRTGFLSTFSIQSEEEEEKERGETTKCLYLDPLDVNPGSYAGVTGLLILIWRKQQLKKEREYSYQCVLMDRLCAF